MADTAVAITAGSGTNIDTRTESTNGNHRQVVVIGDPATNAGVATVTDGAPTATDYALVVGLHPDSVNANGQATMANSAPVVLSSNHSDVPVKLGAAAGGRTTQALSLSVVQSSFEYETVAASQTDQILGATGGVGDYLEGLLCVVATAATSQVQIKDGNGSAITVLPNAVGAGVGTYYVPIGLLTVNATTPGWKITTAAGVSVIGTGKFT